MDNNFGNNNENKNTAISTIQQNNNSDNIDEQGIPIEEVVSKIKESINNNFLNLEKLNIVISGKTGVGKSTLLNAIFGEEVVKTDIGKPVTQEIKKIEKEGFPLTIYDTPGLELGGMHSKENLLNEIREIIKEGIESGDISKAIHIILYCVNTKCARFEDAEADFVRQLSESADEYNVPVIVVLTQTQDKKKGEELKKVIEKENLKVRNIIPVLAKDEEIDLGNKIIRFSSFGLEELAREIEAALPEAIKKTFASIQREDLKIKISSAIKIVEKTAAEVSEIYISAKDKALPKQIEMLAQITTCFGINDISQSAILAIISAINAPSKSTSVVKKVLSQTPSLFPVAAMAFGGPIGWGIAGATFLIGGLVKAAVTGFNVTNATASLGEAYIIILKRIYTGEVKQEQLETAEGVNMIQTEFKRRLEMSRDTKGKLYYYPPFDGINIDSYEENEADYRVIFSPQKQNESKTDEQTSSSENISKQSVKVVGVGGAGCKIINSMIGENSDVIEFIAVDTDRMSLSKCSSQEKVYISWPNNYLPIGVAISESRIKNLLEGSQTVIILAAMGGKTGSGAAPVIAKIAKEMGILTVCVAITPFSFEGKNKMAQANAAITALKYEADSVIVMSNQALILPNDTLSTAFQTINKAITGVVRSLAQLMHAANNGNISFGDIEEVMRGAGIIRAGAGVAPSADMAARAALSSPMLGNPIDGCKSVIANISAPGSVGEEEIARAVSYIGKEAGADSKIIWGCTCAEKNTDQVTVTVYVKD